MFKELYRPVNGTITLSDNPGFGIELAADLEKQYPYIPAPNTVANLHFLHASPRALAREEMIRRWYAG